MRCKICRVEKPWTSEDFEAGRQHKDGSIGLRRQCRACRSTRRESWRRSEGGRLFNAAYFAEYIASGRSADGSRRRRQNNPESARRSAAKWRANNQDYTRESARRWRQNNPEKVLAKRRRAEAKLMAQPSYVLKRRIKARLRQLLKSSDSFSRSVIERMLGYTSAELKRHIERQFTDGMTWDWLMQGHIHIDHIIPVSLFNFTSPNDPEFKACWALSNLRPMWAIENQRKQARRLTLL